MSDIAVFGVGYVGCVTAACLSRDGHRVLGVDVDAVKAAQLAAGQPTVSEPGLADLVHEAVLAGRLSATTDPAEAVRRTEMALVAVGTPSSSDGSVSTVGVERVIAAIGQALRDTDRPYTVVLRSTLLPGILEERLGPLLVAASGRELGDGLHLVNNPEFLREGLAILDYDNPPFVLVGADDAEAAAQVLELYRGISAETIVSDTRSVALIKYACNAFHALKVAFANEVGSLAGSFGADGHQIMDILCRDTKLNIAKAYLRPGFAFGGSCLPKDLRALTRHAERAHLRLDLLASVLPSNESHLRRAIERVQESGHRRIGLVGLSFKAGTDDLRESPLVILAETLLGRGFDLKIYDPGVVIGRLRGRNSAYVDRHMPHIASLLVDDPAELYRHASLLMLGNDTARLLNWQAEYAGEVLDLRRDLAVPQPDLAAELSLAGTP